MQHQQKQSHADFSALLQTVAVLEEELRVTNVELRNVKRELNTMRNSLTPDQRSTGERLVKTAKTALRKAGEQLRSIREKIVQSAKKTLENVRQTGISGLNGLSNLLGVRKTLRGLKTQIGRTATTLETGISRMEAAGKELPGAGEHLRNIRRTLVGREPVARQTEKKVVALVPCAVLPELSVR